MTRFTVKKSNFGMGWETAMRQIATTYDNPPTAAGDFDWKIFSNDLDLSDAKPTMTRDQQHYVGTDSRMNTMTFEGGFNNDAKLTVKGNLRYAHVLNAVLGGCVSTTTASATTFLHTISIGDRPSFFTYYQHGNGTVNHLETLLGCKADDVTIEGKENEAVSIEMNALVAKMVACNTTYALNSSSKALDPTVPYFHWKHSAVNLTIGGVTYTSSTQNQVEGWKINYKNDTKYKHGSPSTGGQANPNYSTEGKFEPEITLTLYPEDTKLWALSPHENKYADTYASSSVSLTITLTRTTTYDTLTFNFTDLAVMKVTEAIKEIKDNVSPVEVTLKPARNSSSVYCVANDPCETYSYSG